MYTVPDEDDPSGFIETMPETPTRTPSALLDDEPSASGVPGNNPKVTPGKFEPRTSACVSAGSVPSTISLVRRPLSFPSATAVNE